MRLKTLELQGYKSFAARTVFHFDTGITAIVGPNGSGKSNVADAVRWVLGEQSYSALRGKKTEDMIFSGSDGRARLGMASATLVFDNSDGWLPVDFSEVTITRRAFRDGQNEYLLNGSRVRLRDINELLATSGLSKRTYTHVGQGMVDAALSLRSEERRTLVEEAAGITLHHSRRADALSKLDTTHDNLLRLNDIVSEIEPRLRYLERQAERANTHQVISVNLKSLLRTWYGFRWSQGQHRLREARTDESRSLAAVQDQADELEKTAAGIGEVRSRQNELRVRLGELHRESSLLHTEAESLQRALAVGQERARLLDEQHDEMLGEVEVLAVVRREVQTRADEARAALQQLDYKLESARSQASALAAQLDAHQARRQQLLDRQAQAEKRTRQLADQIAGHSARLGQFAERRAQLEREAAQASAALAGHEQACAAVKQQLTDKERAASALATTLEQLQARHEERSAAIRESDRVAAQLRDDVNTERRRLDALRARHDVLSKMQRDMVGYHEGVRSVLALADERSERELQTPRVATRNSLRGILGTVTQLLHVPSHLETAIETALGGHLQDIVVETWQDAEAAINHLKSTHAGRATFLPLDTIRPARPLADVPGSREGDPPTTASVLGIGADLVTCEERMRPVARLLLGNTIVAQDLPTARQVLRATRGDGPLSFKGGGFQIVTLAGDLVRSGGSVSGGSLGHDRSGSGFLARQREWQELPAAIQAGEAAEQTLLHRLEDNRAAQAKLHAALEEMNRRRAELEAERTAATREYAALSHELERAEQAAQWQQDLLNRAGAERTRLEQSAGQLAAEVEQFTAEQVTAQSEIRRMAEQAAALTAEALLTELSHAQTELAVVEGRANSQRAVLEGHVAAGADAEGRLNAKRSRGDDLARESAALVARLADQHERAVGLTSQIDAITGLIGPAEEQLAQLAARQGELEAEEGRQRERGHRLETEHSRLALELNRRQDELELLQRQIEDDLGLVEMDLSDSTVGQPPLPLHPLISQLPPVEEVPDDMEQEIRQLRVQLSQIGSVNLNAPQEHEEIRRRHQFLSGQITDLEQAALNLRHIIAELDRLMEGSFLSTFQAVNAEFKTYFRQLFNGGDAELVLTNPDDITQTGIEITARPPGKRARALSMLSGGERALTAASLIFALLKVSPTPFCTLDEVDAMLDEANVGRFRDVLEDLSSQTQFIVITHNRRTVEAARTIYGVSMSDDTASRVISLQFDDIDQK